MNVELPKESDPSVLQTRDELELAVGALDGEDEEEEEDGQEVADRDNECVYDMARFLCLVIAARRNRWPARHRGRRGREAAEG